MNQVRGNIWVKLTALVLAVITGCGVILSGLAVVLYGIVPELWESETQIERKIDERLLRTYGAFLCSNYVRDTSFDELDALDGGNIRYTVVLLEEKDRAEAGTDAGDEPSEAGTDAGDEPSETGTNTGDEPSDGSAEPEMTERVLYTNDASVNAENCILAFEYAQGDTYTYNLSSFFDALRGARCYRYLHYDSGSLSYLLHGEPIEGMPIRVRVYFSVARFTDSGQGVGQLGDGLYCGLKDYTEGAGRAAALVCRFRSVRGWWLALFSLGFVVTFVFLMCAAGRRCGETEISLRVVDRIPFGLYFVGTAGLETAAIALGFVFLDEWFGYNGGGIDAGLSLGIPCVLAVLGMALGICFCMSIAVRIKAKKFMRYTLLYYMIRPFGLLFGMMKSSVPLFVKGVAFLIVLSVLELIVISACQYDFDWMMVAFFCYKLVEFPLFIYVLYQMSLLKQGGMRVAAGDYSRPIDTSHMLWEFKRHGENINRVGSGISLAVEERLKSERLRTELITNVSHDIKTPLTSIINYVDLMKKQNVEDETMKEYMDVLDRQSSRLKKLIEDLMEASKASTGNLPVNLEDCDAKVILSQIVGEYEERAKESGLELVVTVPGEEAGILVDGRHLWRVIDNLMVNICKYAMSGTRVYIDLEVFHGMVIMTFKNVSRYRLNIDSAELTERFVRGDSSRNTEGSGLGLSIAQSLVALMNGNMAIQIDGDLFKAIVSFPKNQ